MARLDIDDIAEFKADFIQAGELKSLIEQLMSGAL